MGTPQVDWSFADAPEITEPVEAVSPARRGRPPRRWPSRRLIIGLLAVAGVVGFGAWQFTRLGWVRLQGQLAAQVAYEDQQARAGDVAAVLAVQAPGSPAWLDQQAAQVRLGLAAPLPAGDLQPAGTPPRLARMDALGGDLFAATVTRDYLDSAGRTFSFDLIQRYRNLAPGQWERLPPDTTALSLNTVFQGERLRVTLPGADRPWLEPALRQADDLLVETCADWGVCPDGRRLAVTFGDAPELNRPTVSVRTAEPVPGGYPLVFDLAGDEAGPESSVLLAAPLLAGRPHDAAAQAALNRSISVRLLALFAGELSGVSRTAQDYFLDALVARAEARRLGGPAVRRLLAPQDFIPIGIVWQSSFVSHDFFRNDLGGWRTDLVARQEAFDFLNLALAAQPASADGALLMHLRRPPGLSLNQWFSDSLGSAVLPTADAWENVALAGLAGNPEPDWQPYEGVVMACSDGVYQVQAGQPRSVPKHVTPGLATLGIGDVSLDGRYLAIINAGEPPPGARLHGYAVTITVLDLSTGVESIVEGGPPAAIIGWSATGQLIFVVPNPVPDSYSLMPAYNLIAYDPADGSEHLLFGEAVSLGVFGPNVWSADHSKLVWTVVAPGPAGLTQGPLGVYTFGAQPRIDQIGESGGEPALSPDGRQVAFISTVTGGPNRASSEMKVLDRANPRVRYLAFSWNTGEPPEATRFWVPQWSPDGQQLGWSAGSPSQIQTAPVGGGAVKMWTIGRQPVFLRNFSPDGRYLMGEAANDKEPIAQGVQNYLSLKQLWLFDQQSKIIQGPASLWAYSTLWMPGSHRLLAAGPAGITSLDPATGEYEWLGSWERCQLRR